MQSNHFHIRCFTCQGRTSTPKKLLARLPHSPGGKQKPGDRPTWPTEMWGGVAQVAQGRQSPWVMPEPVEGCPMSLPWSSLHVPTVPISVWGGHCVLQLLPEQEEEEGRRHCQPG